MSHALPARDNRAPWLRDALWRKARSVPSFDIDANYSATPVDRISGQNLSTFTRAADATYVDADGVIRTAGANTLRRQWDATNGRWGWLVEEARTNLLLQSNQFNTTWTNSNTTETAAAGTAPDGTNTAWLLTDTVDGAPAVHDIRQSLSVTSGVIYTFSVFAKAETIDQVGLRFSGTAFSPASASRYSLSLGTVTSTPAGGSTSIQSLGNGWHRCSLTVTASATGSGIVDIRTSIAGSVSYTGAGTGTVLVWGAQLEAGAFPTSYIPTGAATATRDADVWTVTGTNFSRWYRQDQGSFYMEAVASSNPATSGAVDGVFGLDDTTTSNVIFAGRVLSAGNTFRFDSRNSGSNDAAFNTGSLPAFAAFKAAVGIQVNNYAASVNGGAVATDFSVIVPTVTGMKIGYHRFSAAGSFNSLISRLAYFPARLSNPILQELTR